MAADEQGTGTDRVAGRGSDPGTDWSESLELVLDVLTELDDRVAGLERGPASPPAWAEELLAASRRAAQPPAWARALEARLEDLDARLERLEATTEATAASTASLAERDPAGEAWEALAEILDAEAERSRSRHQELSAAVAGAGPDPELAGALRELADEVVRSRREAVDTGERLERALGAGVGDLARTLVDERDQVLGALGRVEGTAGGPDVLGELEAVRRAAEELRGAATSLGEIEAMAGDLASVARAVEDVRRLAARAATTGELGEVAASLGQTLRQLMATPAELAAGDGAPAGGTTTTAPRSGANGAGGAAPPSRPAAPGAPSASQRLRRALRPGRG